MPRSRRRGWRSRVALGAAYLLAVQALLAGLATGVSAARLPLDAFDFVICGSNGAKDVSPGAEQQSHGLHRAMFATEVRCHLVTFTMTASDEAQLALLALTVNIVGSPEQRKNIEAALYQWKFKPHEKDGRPVEIETGVMFRFARGQS